MGRYSSVQAYADNNANMRSVPYDQATGRSSTSGGSVVRPEKVSNPYGSTAGAGSGDFHVYRHARAREAERWKQMNEEEKKKTLDKEFREKVEKAQSEEERKTEQRRRKRQRAKEAKKRKRNLELSGVKTSGNEDEKNYDDEFDYTPISDEKKEVDEMKNEQAEKEAPTRTFANDGSFLEVMKARMAAEAVKCEDDESPPPQKKQATFNENS